MPNVCDPWSALSSKWPALRKEERLAACGHARVLPAWVLPTIGTWGWAGGPWHASTVISRVTTSEFIARWGLRRDGRTQLELILDAFAIGYGWSPTVLSKISYAKWSTGGFGVLPAEIVLWSRAVPPILLAANERPRLWTRMGSRNRLAAWENLRLPTPSLSNPFAMTA
jgi:hypothetical protein